MNHKERIELYISGLTDAKTGQDVEDALLSDNSFFEDFIEAAERRLHVTRPGFTAAVMDCLPDAYTQTAKVSAFSRKLFAAACLCSAAVIMLVTISGFNQYADVFGFISEQYGKVGDLIALAENITFNFGGN